MLGVIYTRSSRTNNFIFTFTFYIYIFSELINEWSESWRLQGQG
jgi:hypothetical protein